MSILGSKVNKIVGELKKGDSSALERLHELTYNHLLLVAFNYLADNSYADDVLNESYFKICRYIKSSNEDKDTYNWMCKIVQNVAYDYNKSCKISTPINKIESQTLFYDLDDKIIENNHLLQIISKLHNSDQELIYLKFWEDLSYSEIAAKKSMKKSTVYKRLQSLLKIIKKKFSE